MIDRALSIADAFSPHPAGRYPSDGPDNGQRFREEILIPQLRDALSHGARLSINFGGADSYSSSFLEEAFGGLIRSKKFDVSEIRRALHLFTDEDFFDAQVKDAKDYIAQALKR